MPCFKCSKLQTDPVKGSSPWARFVLDGEQVLLCPDCQADDPSWREWGDQCQSCGSRKLSIVMGSIICKACGSDFERVSAPPR